MDTWDFWDQYKALDKFPNQEVQGTASLNSETPPLLDRVVDYSEQITRFLLGIQKMPRAWGARPWSSHELIKAGNRVANDLFRKKMKRDLGLR